MNKSKDSFYLASLLYGLGIPIDKYCSDVSKDEIAIIEQCYALSIGKNDSKISNSPQRGRLVPIVETVGRVSIDACKYSTPILPMSLTKNFFPEKAQIKEDDYSALLNALREELDFISKQNTRAFADSLLSLIEKYTCCVPYSSEENTDISMFDYIKTSTAMAVCHYDNNDAKSQYLLLGADFSGIQSYIYQIVSKHAGKNLKGRSFYVRLLSDAVVHYLLDKLSLYKVNVIYNSGGGFYFLVPNNKTVKEQINIATTEIEKKFFETHGTSIYVAIDYVELSAEVLRLESKRTLCDVWGELFKKRDRKKYHKFASLLESTPSMFFLLSLSGGDVKVDSITGEEIADGEMVTEIDGLLLKETTKAQIELGKVLKDTVFMVCSKQDIPELKTCVSITPAGLGVRYYFLKSKDAVLISSISEKEYDINVISLNEIDYDWKALNLPRNISSSYVFYGGNVFNGNTFEQMGAGEELNRLGVLRMDVDNLGNIFQRGIPADRATIVRFAALSRSFDYFFSGYLNTIWKEVAPDHTYIIYSGGDDVFIVGRWDKTIEMAKRIKEDFKAYTCNNPMFSISGGISIVSPKFPIMKAAEISGEEESNAKNHRCKGDQKSSLSFMQMPLNWEKEFPIVEALKSQIVYLLSSGDLPSSFVSKVLTHYANAKIKKHKISEYKTYWMLTYDLSRMRERIKNENAKKIIDNCKLETVNKRNTLNDVVIDTDYHPLELWAMACRWAELEIRTN